MSSKCSALVGNSQDNVVDQTECASRWSHVWDRLGSAPVRGLVRDFVTCGLDLTSQFTPHPRLSPCPSPGIRRLTWDCWTVTWQQRCNPYLYPHDWPTVECSGRLLLFYCRSPSCPHASSSVL